MLPDLCVYRMDPDSVKSTLQNLAFGNVLAAAARDYKKVLPSFSFLFFFLIFINSFSFDLLGF